MSDEEVEDLQDEEAGEQQTNSRSPWLAPYQFKRGQSGNPAGRPKGMSLKEWARNYLAGLNDEERLEYLEGLSKGTVWKMAEGQPPQQTDITTGGRPIIMIAPEIANKNQIQDAPDTSTDNA